MGERIAWVAVLVVFSLLAADYGWWRGFYMGADTSLCLLEHQVDGSEAAMRGRACQNIKGKKPPVDIFGMRQP